MKRAHNYVREHVGCQRKQELRAEQDYKTAPYKAVDISSLTITHPRKLLRGSSKMVYKLRSIVITFSILVVVASAHNYKEWNQARHRWNDLFAPRVQETGARIRSQPQANVNMSSCATVSTEMKDGKSYSVRLCTADPEGMSLHTVHLYPALKENQWSKFNIGTILRRFRGEPIKKWEGLMLRTQDHHGIKEMRSPTSLQVQKAHDWSKGRR